MKNAMKITLGSGEVAIGSGHFRSDGMSYLYLREIKKEKVGTDLLGKKVTLGMGVEIHIPDKQAFDLLRGALDAIEDNFKDCQLVTCPSCSCQSEDGMLCMGCSEKYSDEVPDE